jgi:hypothetical protein
MALIHEPGREAILPLSGWKPPEPDEAEEAYRRLWTGFYHAIGIKERRNDRLRSSLMPKRYWKHMLEMNGSIGVPALAAAQRKKALQPEAPKATEPLPASLKQTNPRT